MAATHAALLPHDRDRLRQQPARTSGTAYEKIAADVIARYKRLAGVDVRFVMGNDEHSQNVFRKRARSWAWIRWPTATRWSGEFRDGLGAARHLVRRLHPDDRAAAQGAPSQELVQRIVRRRRHLRGRLRGLVLRRLRGVQAGEGSRRRAVSAPPDEARVDQGEELLLPAVEVPRPAARSTTPRIRSSSSRSRAATRSCGCSKAGSRTSRSAAPGRRGAFRCRSIRRASSTSGSTR